MYLYQNTGSGHQQGSTLISVKDLDILEYGTDVVGGGGTLQAGAEV